MHPVPVIQRIGQLEVGLQVVHRVHPVVVDPVLGRGLAFVLRLVPGSAACGQGRSRGQRGAPRQDIAAA